MANRLRVQLDKAFHGFNRKEFVKKDAIYHVHQFKNKKDQEVVAFFSALLAYGNITTIQSSVQKVVDRIGTSPYKTLKEGPVSFPSFTHRFTKGCDLEVLSYWLHKALEKNGSLQNFFIAAQPSSVRSLEMKALLSNFVYAFTNQPLPKRLSRVKSERHRNLKYLISDPMDGSACKRLNMFLRWVVRPKDGIDLGIWDKVSPSQLMLPIDTHLIKVLNYLGWANTKNPTWKTVESASDKLRQIYPNDPIRYDFALCHLSMEGVDFNKVLGA